MSGPILPSCLLHHSTGCCPDDPSQSPGFEACYSSRVPELSVLQAGLLLLAVAAVAFLYSSVGHGGATGYLAVAALAGLTPAVARPGALWMNCFVAGVAFWRFQRAGFFELRLFGTLSAASVPCAWLGSRLELEGRAYAWVLGVALLAAGWFLGRGIRSGPADRTPPRGPAAPIASAPRGEGSDPGPDGNVACVENRPVLWIWLAGGGLGFLAGLTGIGGGVFLTPLLIFLRWTPVKTAGGISALFIVVNSVAGLAGLGHKALVWQPPFIAAIVLGVASALAGTHCGVVRWRTMGFRRALATVLWIAAAKLMLTGK